MRNKLKYWRHQLMMDQTQFANHLGFLPGQINKWEHQKPQPSIDNLWIIYVKLKSDFPDLHLEDLLDPAK